MAETCQATGTYFRTVDKHKDSPACEECGGETRQRITPVRGFGDIEEYVSPVTGKLIRGRRQRQYDLESNNCRPYEGTDVEVREAAKRRKELAAKEEKQLDETIQRTITDLDASNRLTRTGPRDEPLPDLSNVRTY